MNPRRRKENVRIGPISIFTLVIVLCLAVLAVLAFSTGNASLVMAQRQADATTQLYLDEAAAQEFVAQADARLAGVRDAGGGQRDATRAVAGSLTQMVEAAEAAVDGHVEATASIDGEVLEAEFNCSNGRMLQVRASILDDATLRIDKWKMTAVQNEPEPDGQLWTGM